MNLPHPIGTSKAARVFPQLVPQEQITPPSSPRGRDRSKIVDQVAKPAESPDRYVRSTVLSISNIHQHGELFVNYLKMRREIFILRKGWALPETQGMEFDQYDTPYARWVVLHEYGEILAGVRIAPTSVQCGQHSYMIRDAQLGLLPSLPDNVLYADAPVNDKIWEATRLFVSPEVSSSRRLQIQYRLIDAMAEAGREVGATHVIGIVPAVFRRWMNRIGMSATAVGPEMHIDGDRVQAALMDVRQSRSERAGSSSLSRVA